MVLNVDASNPLFVDRYDYDLHAAVGYLYLLTNQNELALGIY